MFRRKFIESLTLAGASSLATIGAANAGDTRTVTYRIKGFSCATCAVGLDTLLRQQKGVVHSRSTYPDAMTVIEFNSTLVGESSLKAFIAEMGFTAEEVHNGGK